jgi:hypothetical protein
MGQSTIIILTINGLSALIWVKYGNLFRQKKSPPFPRVARHSGACCKERARGSLGGVF